MTHDFHPGQRWISESEPELGLGSILKTDTSHRHCGVQGQRAAAGVCPQQRSPSAGALSARRHDPEPQGQGSYDRVRHRGAQPAPLPQGKAGVHEEDLSDTISFNKPEERLFAGQFDPPAVFDLRVAALEHQYRRRKSAVRGFLGGRIDLLPHQLYIASEVSSRLAPRVLAGRRSRAGQDD